MRFAVLAAALVTMATTVAARPTACWTSVSGERRALLYESTDPVLRESQSYRERLFGGRGRITCPGYVTLRAMTPDLTDAERAPFCLQYDRPARTYSGFVVGVRDAYVGCRKPSRTFCERVNATKAGALALASFGAGIVSGANTAATAAGVTAVEHASGAIILTGSGGYIAGTLGTLASGALSVLTAPATVTATAVTVVAVGGAVYVCSD